MTELLSFDPWKVPREQLRGFVSYLQGVLSERTPLNAFQELHQLAQQQGLPCEVSFQHHGKGEERWLCELRVAERYAQGIGPSKAVAKERAAYLLKIWSQSWCSDRCGCLKEPHVYTVPEVHMDRELPTGRETEIPDTCDDISPSTIEWVTQSEEDKRQVLDAELEKYMRGKCSPTQPVLAIHLPDAVPEVEGPPTPTAGPDALAISGLAPEVSACELAELFQRCGVLDSVTLHEDEDGVSTGEATLRFTESRAAARALRDYQGVFVEGRPLTLAYLEEEHRTLLRVSGLSCLTFYTLLRAFFERVGPVNALIRDNDRTVAHVQYRYRTHTLRALEHLNGARVSGHNVRVTVEAIPDDEDWEPVTSEH